MWSPYTDPAWMAQNYHNQNEGQPYAFSGYLGRPAYASEMPSYEQAAYGFKPPGGQLPGQGAGQWYGNYWVPNQGGQGGGGGGMTGSQSYAMQSQGGDPWGYQAAASNAIAQMYKRIRGRSQTQVNTDLAKRGIFSSGVAGGIMGDKMHELDLNEAADIAKLYQSRYDQMLSQSSSGGGGNPSAGGFGPWNMGGFGASLPGFLPSPGSKAVDTGHDGSRPGSMFGASGNIAWPKDQWGNPRPGAGGSTY